MRVSPLAFSHPPAGNHFCVAKVLLQKRKTPMWVSFFFGAGDEARLATGIPRMAEPFAGALPDLLIQRAPRRSRQRVFPDTARKGECEGETFAGFPTRVQSPARRQPLLRSKSVAPKKKDTHVGVFLFWSGRRGSNSLPRPWQGRALPDELRPQNGASGRGRTGDTRIFSPLLYQLSYRGIWRPRRGSNPRPPA